MSAASKEFHSVLSAHLDGIYNFAYRVTNSVERAEEVTREVLLRAYAGRKKLPKDKHVGPWLLKIAVHVVSQADPGPRMTFEHLDDTIRGDPTQVTRTGTLTDPQRQFLLWELKQGCMTAVLSCLSSGERMAFVVTEMMALPTDEAAATLGITAAALKVRLSRARKKIVNYLAPRCEHVHPDNPCRCPSRLGVALRKGFIQDLSHREVSLRKMPPEILKPSAPLRDVLTIYQQLPAPTGLSAVRERLEAELLGGEWDRLLRGRK
jgi:RNA polymerase sigma-70 factor (ECF subfamily)